jgi:hypothetical protein
MTPNFSHAVLECVTRLINDRYDKFLQIHPDFVAGGGKCTLMGHSLGSVIAWDLLAVLKQAQETASGENGNDEHGVSVVSKDDFGCHAYVREETSSGNSKGTGTWGPSLTKFLDRHLPFVPEATIFLGSPLGIFLTLRGAHPVFDEMRRSKTTTGQQQATCDDIATRDVSPFTLPTTSLYNIFHPSDPVAYRIEPLLLSTELDPDNDLPMPAYLTAPGKTVRLDLKAKQLGDEFRKNLDSTKSTWVSLFQTAASAMATEVPASAGNVPTGRSLNGSGGLVFPLGGKSPRVDFSLQPGVIQNEYIRYELSGMHSLLPRVFSLSHS